MNTININTSNRINSVSPILYGIFFEDINYAGDGGLYAELIANRSFEYYDRNGVCDKSQMCWDTIGDIKFQTETGFPLSKAHKSYARLTGAPGSGIRNLGFCREGLAVKDGQTFRFSCFARNAAPMRLTVRLADKEGNLYGSKTFPLVRVGQGWTKYKVTLTATGTCKYVFPEIILETEGQIDLELISLFPTDTFNGRENGMRKDLAQMLKDLSPRFMRFPGGCIVEGRSFENMYNWKETVGPLENRRTNWNRWQVPEYQINGQNSDDYFQSYGIGYYEYFCLCEDIGAKPVPVMNVGMTCQWHEALLVDMDKLDQWIQDILDLIEFANGSENTRWGGLRAQMGHPAPFNLEYIGIGNEQWGDVYFERYEAFQKVLSGKHPEIRLITCAGWTSEGADFDLAYRWMRANKEKAYAVDEHFYKSPEWFLENLHRYDSYDRSLPKVFAGEYAAHTDGDTSARVNNWYAALCEAAFLTGIEQNADHVVMSCYAPLFGRTGHQQWQPDLIWFDNNSVYGTPSFYVQKIFSRHVGQALVELQANIDAVDENSSDAAKAAGTSLPMSATLSADGSTLYVKIVNLESDSREITLHTDKQIVKGSFIRMAASPDAVNSHDAPENVVPTESMLETFGDIALTLEGYSVNVLELELK